MITLEYCRYFYLNGSFTYFIETSFITLISKLKNLLQTHASSCGEEFVMDVAEPDQDERRKCDFCDKNFSLDADYEIHVKKCELQHKQPNK